MSNGSIDTVRANGHAHAGPANPVRSDAPAAVAERRARKSGVTLFAIAATLIRTATSPSSEIRNCKVSMAKKRSYAMITRSLIDIAVAASRKNRQTAPILRNLIVTVSGAGAAPR